MKKPSRASVESKVTREEARKVLNQVREGSGAWTGDQIRDALTATGDLEPHAGLRSPTLAQPLPGDRQYLGWGSTVVAANLRGH